MYVDKTRNVAVVLGVKDVKSDIKDKNRLKKQPPNACGVYYTPASVLCPSAWS